MRGLWERVGLTGGLENAKHCVCAKQKLLKRVEMFPSVGNTQMEDFFSKRPSGRLRSSLRVRGVEPPRKKFCILALTIETDYTKNTGNF